MARHRFERTGAMWMFAPGTVDGQRVPVLKGGTATAYDAPVGGNPLLDLIDALGAPTTDVAIDADGFGPVEMYGPDGDPEGPRVLWLDGGGGIRVAWVTSDPVPGPEGPTGPEGPPGPGASDADVAAYVDDLTPSQTRAAIDTLVSARDYATAADVTAASTTDRDRTNHTGAQAIGTVTGLQTALDAKTDITAILLDVVRNADGTYPARPSSTRPVRWHETDYANPLKPPGMVDGDQYFGPDGMSGA